MRARALSRDWGYHTWLLERTLDSIVAQTSLDYDAVVVCHDIPEIAHKEHPKVHFVSVDFPPPGRISDDMYRDKVLKITRGIEWASRRCSEYVMFVDADDLVSRRLASFVSTHSGKNGWYIKSGFTFRYGDRWLRKSVPHHMICGTCAIVRTDLLMSSKSEFCRGETANTLANAGHTNYVSHLEAQGAPIEPLPFPGAVYVIHAESTSTILSIAGRSGAMAEKHRPAWRRTLSWGKRAVKELGKLRPLTNEAREEFTIPHATHWEAEHE